MKLNQILLLAAAVCAVAAVSADKPEPLGERLQRINSQITTAQARHAQVQSQTADHWVVVLAGTERYEWGPDNVGRPVSFELETVSSSKGAPKFNRGEDLADALATLRGLGAEITIHAWGYLTYTAVK